MEILGLEKVSLVDWEEKVCATIFTGGCNFLCPFCHNNGVVKRNLPLISEIEVLDYLKSRKGLLDGVVISGGEPTLQRDLLDFIKKVKDIGLKVKLDTNGSNPQILKKLLESGLVDYVAMDIKNDFNHYDEVTGLEHPNVERVKESLELLKQMGVDYELRTTLIDEYHKKENIMRMANELKGAKRLYLQKFVRTDDLIQPLYILTEVKKSQAEEFKKILERTIDFVELRHY